ncbi:transketolase C-terminal domain-containing protein [Desulforamulus profundi]|uniref:transketolase C-terminal domain-containing protein n=1 Tax=Desulforamulus profundi TaxID=1383067 RepID=UPI001EE5D99F|nr:transketolase C-terminal domain-containing protein [Desulforamulus profundi]
MTHSRDNVEIAAEDIKLPPYNPYNSPVPVMDMENVPIRQMRDPFVMKSNFISYAAHASWQQEILAAAERARKYIHKYLGGLVETDNEGAEILVVASGTAVSQSREAVALARQEGIDAGLIRIKSLRPFPTEEIKEMTKKAKAVIIPEFNRVGCCAGRLNQ